MGYADDLILVSDSHQALEEAVGVAHAFFVERLLTLNRKKSQVLVLGPRFGASLPREVLGIGVRRSAKYLGLTYHVELRLKSSIRSFMPKISGVGEWRSCRAEECYLLFQKTVRKTLRRMTRAPRNASSEILDYLSG